MISPSFRLAFSITPSPLALFTLRQCVVCLFHVRWFFPSWEGCKWMVLLWVESWRGVGGGWDSWWLWLLGFEGCSICWRRGCSPGGPLGDSRVLGFLVLTLAIQAYMRKHWAAPTWEAPGGHHMHSHLYFIMKLLGPWLWPISIHLWKSLWEVVWVVGANKAHGSDSVTDQGLCPP